ncbi:MAG: two pore domain potassium channel family protein [Eubacterium sp.]|nr:two pore domain potassium channel family protein [Eubacterium sp.]
MYHIYQALLIYLAFSFVLAFILAEIEPDIPDVGTGLWYCFSTATTTGFGDVTAVTALGRVLTVIYGIISLFMVAVCTAVVVHYFQEKQKIKMNESVVQFLDQMDHLDKLSKEELQRMSEQFRKYRKSGRRHR